MKIKILFIIIYIYNNHFDNLYNLIYIVICNLLIKNLGDFIFYINRNFIDKFIYKRGMAEDFKYSKLTCCSVELHWNYKNNESYEIYQKEGGDHFITNPIYFKKIYEGQKANFEVINLKSNQEYAFKLKKIKGKSSEEKIIVIKTLNSPYAILSEKSDEIAIDKKIKINNNNISELQQRIIKNCARLNFVENNDNVIKGSFDGIKIKITHEIETNIYYICFDIKSKYYCAFFQEFIKQRGNDILIPCHFILKKLPTILIFNLLEKGCLVFTGKRMGGLIASSLAFYILYIGKKMNNQFGNTFLKKEKKSIGVVTFGSPSFLTNLTAGLKMKDMTSYFCNIKDESDFIPEIIDFIRKYDNNLLTILNKNEFDNNDIKALNTFWEKYGIPRNNLKQNIITFPFGYYYEMNKQNC